MTRTEETWQSIPSSITSMRIQLKIGLSWYDSIIITKKERDHYNHYSILLQKGLKDLREGIVRTPLPAETTFLDDPLRILRYYSFDQPSTLHQLYVVAFHLCSKTKKTANINNMILCTFDFGCRAIRFASRLEFKLHPDIITAATQPHVKVHTQLFLTNQTIIQFYAIDQVLYLFCVGCSCCKNKPWENRQRVWGHAHRQTSWTRCSLYTWFGTVWYCVGASPIER